MISFLRAKFAFTVCAATLLALGVAAKPASAQEGQGKYITEASVLLIKMVNSANKDGFKLQDNLFSIGGGWLKQSKKEWVPLFSLNLKEGATYRFLAAGDADATDVDIRVVDATGKVVAADTSTARTAIKDYTPDESGRYTVQVRLYASDGNLPCVCLAIVMSK